MNTLPVPIGGAAGVPALDSTDGLDRARDYALAEKSDATRKAYRSDFKLFGAWCAGLDLDALPASPATVARYLAALADSGLKASTIARRAAAIGYAHKLAGREPPTNAEMARATLRGIRRSIGTRAAQKAPATADVVAELLAAAGAPVEKCRGRAAARTAPDTAGDITRLRDRAVILLGFAAALRRSELVGLDVVDLEFVREGVLVHLGQTKTDQEGAGEIVGVPNGSKLKPVVALRAWLEAAAIVEGPVFRRIRRGGHVTADRLTPASVAIIVKRYAGAAGFDLDDFAGHSLRAGFVTSALEDGADLLKVMDVTRHREVRTLKKYDRRANAFRNPAGKGFL